MNIPPMAEWDENEPCPAYTAQYVIALGNYAVRGWAEAERLEKEKKSHEEAHWHMVGQYNHVEKERDEARAEAERLYNSNAELYSERDALSAQVKNLAEALDVYAAMNYPFNEVAKNALSRLASDK